MAELGKDRVAGRQLEKSQQKPILAQKTNRDLKVFRRDKALLGEL